MSKTGMEKGDWDRLCGQYLSRRATIRLRLCLNRYGVFLFAALLAQPHFLEARFLCNFVLAASLCGIVLDVNFRVMYAITAPTFSKRQERHYHCQRQSKAKSLSTESIGAGNGIRTHEHLRDWTLNPAPLTWLGNPRKRCRHPHAVVVFNNIPGPPGPRAQESLSYPSFLPTSSTRKGTPRRSSSASSSSMNTPLPATCTCSHSRTRPPV